MSFAEATSFLFVPANRPDRFDKAMKSGAGAVILDLEDAVPATDKYTARLNIAQFQPREKNTIIRINGLHTPWYEQDLRLCEELGSAGIMVPKAESAASLQEISSRFKTPIAIFPLIETASGMANANLIAQVGNVERLVFGTIDFGLELNIPDENEGLLYFRSQLVLASRLAGLSGPIDGITTDLRNPDAVERDTARSKRLGFSGKLCIHPSQVPIVNQGFTPTDKELEWAQQIVQFASSGAATVFDGHMVDRPVLLRAQRILKQAGRS